METQINDDLRNFSETLIMITTVRNPNSLIQTFLTNISKSTKYTFMKFTIMCHLILSCASKKITYGIQNCKNFKKTFRPSLSVEL